MTKYKLLIVIFLIALGVISAFSVQVRPVMAQDWVKEIIKQPLIPEGCTLGKQTEGSCGLKEFFQVGINITQLILGVTGTFALLMFVYGGIMFLTSGGNQEKVTKGKTILINALIGIIIIFTSWMIINLIIIALTKGGEGIGGTGILFEGADPSGWDKPLN